MDMKEILRSEPVLVIIRCGGKGGRCGAVHGAVFPSGDDELIVFQERPCRCFVSITSLDLDQLLAVVAAARQDWEETWKLGLDWRPCLYIARPRPGVRHAPSYRESVEDMERSGTVRVVSGGLDEDLTGLVIDETGD